MIPPNELAILHQLAARHNLLSNRELEILYWWAHGYGIKKTASHLDIHESTVKTHRRRLIEKLYAADAAGLLDAV